MEGEELRENGLSWLARDTRLRYARARSRIRSTHAHARANDRENILHTAYIYAWRSKLIGMRRTLKRAVREAVYACMHVAADGVRFFLCYTFLVFFFFFERTHRTGPTARTHLHLCVLASTVSPLKAPVVVYGLSEEGVEQKNRKTVTQTHADRASCVV